MKKTVACILICALLLNSFISVSALPDPHDKTAKNLQTSSADTVQSENSSKPDSEGIPPESQPSSLPDQSSGTSKPAVPDEGNSDSSKPGVSDPSPSDGKLSFTELQELIDAALKITPEQYTPESFEKLSNYIGIAQNFLSKADITQQEINEVTSTLSQTIESLVLIGSAPPVVPSDENKQAMTILNSMNLPSGALGTQFTVPILVDHVPKGEYTAVHLLLSLPDGVAVKAIRPETAIAGEVSCEELSENVISILYQRSAGTPVTFNWMAGRTKLISLDLELTQEKHKNDSLPISVTQMMAIAAEETIEFDVSSAFSLVTIGRDEAITASMTELYIGDGIDLIEEDEKAVCISFTGIDPEPVITREDASFYYSSEMSLLTGKSAYMGIVPSELSKQELIDIEQFSFFPGSEEMPADDDSTAVALGVQEFQSEKGLIFGDSNGDRIVDAQDALNILGIWLRDIPVDDHLILSTNVNGDGKIDTADVVEIVDNFLYTVPFTVLKKSIGY